MKISLESLFKVFRKNAEPKPTIASAEELKAANADFKTIFEALKQQKNYVLAAPLGSLLIYKHHNEIVHVAINNDDGSVEKNLVRQKAFQDERALLDAIQKTRTALLPDSSSPKAQREKAEQFEAAILQIEEILKPYFPAGEQPSRDIEHAPA